MSDLLGIGATGIRAYSRALSAVSDNIANSQTPGYARRSVRLEEAPGGGDVALYRNAILPGGVLVDGINRSVDQWLVDDARTAGSDAGQSDVRLGWLQATERAIDDGPSGVGQNVTKLFNNADQLASDPNNEALRSSFLQSVDDVASSFRRTASQLASVANGISADAVIKTEALNTSINALKRVNDGLQASHDGSTNQAGLLDERDQLLDRIAASIPVGVEYNAKGAATLQVDGPGSEILLSGNNVTSISSVVAGDGTISYQLSPGSAFAAPSGELAGLSQSASHVAAQRSELDSLANQFVADLNGAHQAGQDVGGNAGVALLVLPAGATSMVAIAIVPSGVAAADASSSNGNMLALSGLRGANGTEAGWANMVALQSQAVSSARAQDSAATSRQDGANAARDDVSGIDLDREAADLLRFQQAYQGAARVLQVARENMQTILNSL